MWDDCWPDFLSLLHGEPPWPFVVESSDQNVLWSGNPEGKNFLFVHKNRGTNRAPGFTSLNADTRGDLPQFPRTPTAMFRTPERWTALWIFYHPVWPSNDFYRRQQMLNTFLGTTPDHAGLARLLPVPGNPEIPCMMTMFEPAALYNLGDFSF
jgi:hypothetical protein